MIDNHTEDQTSHTRGVSVTSAFHSVYYSIATETEGFRGCQGSVPRAALVQMEVTTRPEFKTSTHQALDFA